MVVHPRSETGMSFKKQNMEEFLVQISRKEMTVKVDCNVGTWGPWEERSVTCGGGIRMRCRDVTQETKHGGVPCPNPNYTMECEGCCNRLQVPGKLFPNEIYEKISLYNGSWGGCHQMWIFFGGH